MVLARSTRHSDYRQGERLCVLRGHRLRLLFQVRWVPGLAQSGNRCVYVRSVL
jgi:hypothetical protein